MLKANYKHFVPQAPENPNYEKFLNYVLITDFEDLKDKLHLENEIVSWDTETSSLSPEEGDIVGFSWSTDGITGYYCPVNHIDCQINGAIEYFVSELKKAKLSLLYNARFDIRMVEWHLKKCGNKEDLSFMRNKFIDVMNAVWIADTNYTLPSLKWATRHFLGYQPPKFLETLGDESNFHYVKVNDAYRYTCLDAINTYNVFKVCQCYHNDAGLAGYLDTQASWIIGHLEETPLKLNTEKIKKIMSDVEKELNEIENTIYELAGEKFNIRSNRELTRIFLKLGIDTGERTKAGDMKTSKVLLGSYLERYPDTSILRKIIDYKETFKFYNSYLKTLVEIGDVQDTRPIRFSYKLQAADTTRLSCCSRDTLIYTDHGIKKIIDLKDGELVDDGTGAFYPAVLLDMGKKQLYELQFSDGTTSHLTEDHKILVIGENGYVWKEVKDLTINEDKICVKYNNWRKTEVDELFYLLTALSYQSKLVSDKTLIINIVKCGEVLCNKLTSTLTKNNIAFDNFNNRKLTISGKAYDDLVYLLESTYNINAEEDVFKVDRPKLTLVNSLRKAETFLECVYDVKIYKTNLGDSIHCEFISKNPELLSDIKTVMSFAGISSEPIRPVVSKYKKRTDMSDSYLFRTTSAIFYKYMYNSHYRMGIFPSVNPPKFIKDYILNHPVINYRLFRSEAGKRLLSRFQQTPNFNYCMNFNEEFELGMDIFYPITVMSIKPYKVDDTYTLSVDSDKHRYMSDSFISHNCGKDGKNPFFSKLNLQCLAPETRVKILGGFKYIKDITDNDLVWDGNSFVSCVNLGKSKKELFKITTNKGMELECSSEHQILSINNNNFGWNRLGDLSVGSWIACNRKDGDTEDYTSHIHTGQIELPKGGLRRSEIHVDKPLYDFWFFLGYFIGDGFFLREHGKSNGIAMCVPKCKESVKQRLISGLKEVGIDLFERISKKKGYDDVLVLCSKKMSITSYLSEIGCKPLAREKRLPDIVYSLSRKQRLLVLDGLISSDGSVRNRTSFSYKSMSEYLIKDISYLLETLGYKYSLSSHTSGYVIYIHNKKRIIEEVDITNKSRTVNLKETSYRGNNLPYEYFKKLEKSDKRITNKCNDVNLLESLGYEEAKYSYAKISSIESIGIKECYDLYVPNSNRFTANGFIVHNSIPKPKSCKSYGRRATDDEIANKEDLLGWIFSPEHPEWSPGKCVEGMSLNKNIRDAFIPENGSDDYLVSIDMCSEEACIVTNLFREQYFADIINRGGDIHHENSNRIFGAENYTKETRKKAKCISGDSKVFTSMGIKKVSDLISSRNIGVPVETDFMISTPEGVSKCNGVVYNGKKETLKFILEDESVIEVTPDHLLRSNNKWINAENIKINDKIDLTLCPIDVTDEQTISFDNFIPGTKIPFNEEIAYLTGAILGDGCIDRKVVRYYSEDTELKSYIEYISKKYSLYKKYASDNDHEASRTYNAGKGKSGKDYERLIVGSRKCVELMKAIGIADDNYHKIFRVPEIVNNSPIKVKFAFLQGLFDTDGYVSSQSKGCIAIHLATAHKTLGDDCVTLLRSIGIISRITTEYSKQWNRNYHKVKITAFSSKLFYEYGGFKCFKKQERLKEWYNSENTGKKCYVTGYKVIDIEHSESEVFDLSVNNSSHSFLVNGFVVHNCALFGMLYGQGERGFQQKFPYMSLEEARDFLDNFKALIPNIVRGQARMTREARKNGTFKTTFGHSIRVKGYLTSSNYKDKAFGERKIKNSPIQSCAAEVLKLEFVRLWDNVFTKYPDVKFHSTIHDEINFSVPRRIASEVIPIMIKCMTVKMENWLVPLNCSLSVGYTMGTLIPFKYDFEKKEFIPDWEELIEKSDTKEEDDECLDDIEDDYDDSDFEI